MERATSVKVDGDILELNDIMTSGGKHPTPATDFPRLQVKMECTDEDGKLKVGETLYLTDPNKAAQSLYGKIKEMQMELSIMHLQHRREDEETILTMFVYLRSHLLLLLSQMLRAAPEHSHSGHFCSRDVEFSDATITFLQNSRTRMCRLIVESGNGRSLISHECM